MDCLKVGLQEHVPSAVILQVFSQASLVEVTEKEVTDIISNDKSVEHEEQVPAAEVNTISELRDTFLPAKGFDKGESFSVTEEICNEFLDFIKINDNQAAIIFKKNKMQGNCNFWKEQRCGRVTGSNFYRICHLKESTNTENTLKDLLGYCPLSAERQPIQFEWGHEKEESAIDLYCKKQKKVHKELCVCVSVSVVS